MIYLAKNYNLIKEKQFSRKKNQNTLPFEYGYFSIVVYRAIPKIHAV